MGVLLKLGGGGGGGGIYTRHDTADNIIQMLET